jgi:hypothetical protein
MDSRKYIGMYLHQASISIAVRDANGKLVMESVIETKAATILECIQGIRGNLWVAFEEGTSAAWLYDLLKPHVAQVIVCDPRKNALLKAGNKNGATLSLRAGRKTRKSHFVPVFTRFQPAVSSRKIASVGALRTTGPQRHSSCLAPGREPVAEHLPILVGPLAYLGTCVLFRHPDRWGSTESHPPQLRHQPIVT